MSRRFNIRSFAQRAGYSVATVSRALNPQTASMVKEKTRQEIQQLAAQLNFVPHPGARVLRRNQPAPIAVLLPERPELFLSEYYSRMLMGIMQKTSARGQAVYAMAVTPSQEDFKTQLNEVTVGCESIIYLSDRLTEPMVESLATLHQPFVCQPNSIPPQMDAGRVKVPVLGLDDEKGTRLATGHLIGLGHRRIAFLAGPQSKRDACDRRKGYEMTLEENGLPTNEEWVIHSAYNFNAGVAAADKVQALLGDITAIVCATDEQALGLMRELAVRGVRCPQDISITGFDDMQWAARMVPGLTTITQPMLEMAAALVEMVTPQPGRKHENARVANRYFDPELCVRDSTAAPRC